MEFLRGRYIKNTSTAPKISVTMIWCEEALWCHMTLLLPNFARDLMPPI